MRHSARILLARGKISARRCAGLDEDATLLWFKRPVELDLFDPVPGSTIEIGHIRMLDPQGHDILANGDFSQGTERWYFADDVHLMRRI